MLNGPHSIDRLDGLPERVTICEVGPRDGLQNESAVLPVEVKVEFIERLVDAGHTVVETTSFVHPKWVPQLADAEQVLDRVTRRPGVRYPVLVPNLRGLDRALDRGVTDIAIFGSATESFAQANLNRSVAETLEMFAPSSPAPAKPGWLCGPTCRCASAIPGKASCRSPRSSPSPPA